MPDVFQSVSGIQQLETLEAALNLAESVQGFGPVSGIQQLETTI